MDQPAMHFAAQPIADIAIHVDFATRHLAADVSAGIARDV